MRELQRGMQVAKTEPTPKQVEARLKAVRTAAGVLTALAAAAATVLFKAGSIPAAVFTVGFGVFGVILVAVVSLAVRDIVAGQGKFWSFLIKLLVVLVLVYFGWIAVAIGPTLIEAMKKLVDPPKVETKLPVFPQIQQLEAHTLPNMKLQLSGYVRRDAIPQNGRVRVLGYSSAKKDDRFPPEAFPDIAEKTGATLFEFADRKRFGKMVYLQVLLQRDGVVVAASDLQEIPIVDES